DGTDEEVTLDLINVGDRLRVRPGEKIPVDGVILEGRVSIDSTDVRACRFCRPVSIAGANRTYRSKGRVVFRGERGGGGPSLGPRRLGRPPGRHRRRSRGRRR
ncbi:MAG: hypothetical protein ABI560_09905, partial [Myxococcales bacterium]